MKITHYDLFAGIGGFSLALDTIFHEQKNEHIFCEWEAFPTAVLKKHWPDATYYGDIADLVADTDSQRRERVWTENAGRHGLSSGETPNQEQEMVILTGGFPCQPFSHAGRRQGTSDDRYKWPEMFAVIQNVRPDWIIAENVRGLATWNDGMVLETVCADLESEGYEVQPLIIPAVAVGAPHRRDRVWIVAYDGREHGQQRNSKRLEADTTIRTARPETNQREHQYTWADDWREVAFATCHDGVDDGLPRQMDGVTVSASKHRKERLKACGNAIVPQVAMEIFTAIRHTLGN
jgi:DNA (cytosine-5)-methyltransferase 1